MASCPAVLSQSAALPSSEATASAPRLIRNSSLSVGRWSLRRPTKVRGVLDVVARIAYIDRSLLAVKQTFLKLHETAHAVLPHQRKLYALVEDCEKTISPEVSEQFDREANVFAAEVLFQLDAFIEEARTEPFGIRVPLKLSKKYGASVYASVRQYVCKHSQACCVLIIDPPQLLEGDGFVAPLRRVVTSPEFERQFGTLKWPTSFTPGDDVGAAIPIGKRRMSRARACSLLDQNGTHHECLIEAFNSQHQVFVLVQAINTLTPTHGHYVLNGGVCGQAQRSVRWKGEPAKLFQHLKKREEQRHRAGKSTRFEHPSPPTQGAAGSTREQVAGPPWGLPSGRSPPTRDARNFSSHWRNSETAGRTLPRRCGRRSTR